MTMQADALDLATPYVVTDDLVERYRHDGHVLLRSVATPEQIARYRPAVVAAAMRLNNETRPLAERDTYGKAFLQAFNLWEHDADVRALVFAQRFAGIAARLMGVERLRILHEQSLFKEPGGGITPWHQDQIYWPIDTENCVTMWLPLVDLPEEVGSMTFVSGSHRTAYREMDTISDHSEATIAAHIRAHDLPESRYGAMRAGDATWHAGWTMHKAPANPTPNTREVLTVIYFEDGARVTQIESHPENYGWMTEWYPGLGSGDRWAHARSPLVYPL